MSAGDRAAIEPGSRLPSIALRSDAGGDPVQLRPAPRRSLLLLLLHGTACARCAEFVDLLEAEAERIAEWEADPIIVVSTAGAEGLTGPYRVLVDEAGRLAASLALEPPGVVIADQWGEIHLRSPAGEEHAFPPVAELVSWAQYLAIQCPECQGEAY